MTTSEYLESSPPPPARGASLVSWLVGPVFLGLAAWLHYAPPTSPIPLAPAAVVSRDEIQPGARRHPVSDPAGVVVGGFVHRCNECHRLFRSPPIQRSWMVQHTHITLAHGMNDRCFNCHCRTDREKLALSDGSTIPFGQSARLCAQCHGTVFRDWQRGTHGKTMGSWDAASGQQERLGCVECHDPHAPAYPGITPLPAPNTLRMGDQSPPHEEEGRQRHVPLRLRPDDEAASPHQPPSGTAPAAPQEHRP